MCWNAKSIFCKWFLFFIICAIFYIFPKLLTDYIEQWNTKVTAFWNNTVKAFRIKTFLVNAILGLENHLQSDKPLRKLYQKENLSGDPDSLLWNRQIPFSLIWTIWNCWNLISFFFFLAITKKKKQLHMAQPSKATLNLVYPQTAYFGHRVLCKFYLLNSSVSSLFC